MLLITRNMSAFYFFSPTSFCPSDMDILMHGRDDYALRINNGGGLLVDD